MPPIRTAVVGVGHLGSLHARIYHQLPQAELVGVYDTDRSRALEVAGNHKVRAFSGLDEAAGSVQAVSLAVPTNLHFEIGRQILNEGLHLLVEKPITEKVEQAQELVELAAEKGLVLQVGHVERFNPALVAASEYIRDALYVESERLAPFSPRGAEVPVVLDLMIHDIDIILSIMRRRVVEISALGLPVFTSSVDVANARLTFDGGAVANVASSRVSIKKVRKVRFFSPDRYVSVDMLQPSAICYGKKPGVESLLDRNFAMKDVPDMRDLVVRTKLKLDKSREPLMLELDHFLTCIQERKQPVVSGNDGLQALLVADRIMKAIHQSLDAAGLNPEDP